ncbi:MAG: GIY-YIG nuclease family protein [Burkholderiaceae bacterium]|nr:GIY-YIG nuclease family protein [Burkholderiaceae bacterium]
MTTNSIAQRIRELNSTGVPTSFHAERVFEIPARFLNQVERQVHKRLKHKGNHHGKEFFRIGLSECSQCVEDIILEITGESSVDVVGLAKERKLEADRRREWNDKERLRREKILDEKNSEIRQKRLDWLSQTKLDTEKNKTPESFWSKTGTVLLTLIGDTNISFFSHYGRSATF